MDEQLQERESLQLTFFPSSKAFIPFLHNFLWPFLDFRGDYTPVWTMFARRICIKVKYFSAENFIGRCIAYIAKWKIVTDKNVRGC